MATRIYRSVQGLSGTPSPRTYHHRLKFNRRSALGADGYIETVLKNKKTPILKYSCDMKSVKLEDYFNTLWGMSRNVDKIHAIIDVNAILVGISNLDVAKALGNLNFNCRSPSIRYVLYFNEDDVLCAWDHLSQRSLTLATSDAKKIDEQLHCGPSERLTYYDQAHTLGTDLKQRDDACALCLVDEKILLQDFLQGVMRMRGLMENQSIEIVIPKEVEAETLEDLLLLMHVNEMSQTKEDVLRASVAQLNSVIRREALDILASIEDIDEKQSMAMLFREYFIEEQLLDLFKLYGGIAQYMETKSFLEAHRSHLLSRWEKSLHKAMIQSTNASLQENMSEIIKEALLYCEKNCLSVMSSLEGIEIEIEKEQEKEQELEQLQELHTDISVTKPANEMPSWCNTYVIGSFKHDNSLRMLNKRCDLEEALFSDNLYLSPNFENVYVGQTNLLNLHTKKVHGILFKQGVKGDLAAYFISVKEIEAVKDKLSFFEGDRFWISTPENMKLAGAPPENIELSLAYQVLLEQARFFDGDCSALMRQNTPLIWLREKTTEKLKYLQKCILHYRKTSFQDYKKLVRMLERSEPELSKIHQYSYKEFKETEWKKYFPNANSEELATIRFFANAITEANSCFDIKPLQIGDFEDHLLSCSARRLLEEHLSNLSNIKKALDEIRENPDNIGVLRNLDVKTKLIFNNLFSISLDEHLKIPSPGITPSLLMAFIRSPWIQDKTVFDNRIKEYQVRIPKESQNEFDFYLSLQFEANIDVTRLKELVDQATDEEQIEKIIEHPSCTVEVYKYILNHHQVSPLILEKMVLKTNDEAFFRDVILKEKSKNINILNHVIKNATQLETFECFSEPDLIKKIFSTTCYKTLFENPHTPDSLVSQWIASDVFTGKALVAMLNYHVENNKPTICLTESFRESIQKNPRISDKIKTFFFIHFLPINDVLSLNINFEKLIFSDSTLADALLSSLLKRAQNDENEKELMGQLIPLLKSKSIIGPKTYEALVLFSEKYPDLVDLLISVWRDKSSLSAFVQHANPSDKKKLIENILQNFSKVERLGVEIPHDLLLDIIQYTTSEEVICAILSTNVREKSDLDLVDAVLEKMKREVNFKIMNSLESISQRLSSEQRELLHILSFTTSYLKDFDNLTNLNYLLTNFEGNRLAFDALLSYTDNDGKNIFYRLLENYQGVRTDNAICRLVNLYKVYDSEGKKIKAFLEQKDKHGKTCAHVVKSVSILDILWRDYRVNFEARDDEGRLPIHDAVCRKDHHIIESLHRIVNVSLDTPDTNGNAPIHIAAAIGHFLTICTLINLGVNVNLAGAGKQTALHICAREGHLDIARCFLNRKDFTEINAQDDSGKTALHVAIENSHPDIAHLIIDSGAILSIEDDQGWTPAHVAAKKQDLSTLVFLIDKKAPMTPDAQGLKPNEVYRFFYEANEIFKQAYLEMKEDFTPQDEIPKRNSFKGG